MRPLWQKREICGYLMGFDQIGPSAPGQCQRVGSSAALTMLEIKAFTPSMKATWL
jgi:hypothetical protein